MDYDVKGALTYFFKDKHLILKTVIAYIIVGICSIMNVMAKRAPSPEIGLVILVITFLFDIPIRGYIVNVAHQRIIKPKNELPDWSNFFKYLKDGFIIELMSLIYIVIPATITIKMLMPVLIIRIADTRVNLIVFILAIILLLISVLLMFAAYLSYACDLKFKSIFNFKAFKFLMIKNKKEFSNYISLIILAMICCGTLSLVLTITIVGILLIPILVFYVQLYCADIQAQFLRHIFKIGKKQTTNG